MFSDNDSFVQKIHELVYSQLDSLKSGVKPQSHEWTVISSILMEDHGELSVIVLSTGTKCIGKSSLSTEGLVVNDCHAEVLCRRGFIKFLLMELEKANSGKSSIFSLNAADERYILKDSIKFHMYISQSPCGYGSVYSQQSAKRQAQEITYAKQRQSKRRKLETESSEEDDLHLSGAKFQSNDCMHLSTKPGRGDPSRSYSCSDKLCLWNRVGFQGSLLSKVLDPVFMSSFIIGGPWDMDRMKEALLQRSDANPHIALLHDMEESPFCERFVLEHLQANQKLAACGVSVIWIFPNTLEKLIPNKGIRLGTNYKKGITIKNASILCPKRLFQSFCHLVGSSEVYRDAKVSSKAYQASKAELLHGFMREWERKDPMYYTFTSTYPISFNKHTIHR